MDHPGSVPVKRLVETACSREGILLQLWGSHKDGGNEKVRGQQYGRQRTRLGWEQGVRGRTFKAVTLDVSQLRRWLKLIASRKVA
jgi:hypothetical protein